MADDEELQLVGLYADQDEDTVWARRVAWANEGRTPDDVDQWTDTREGSFFYIATIGGVREDARIYDLMGTEVVAAAHPLFAWEIYLDAHAEVQNMLRGAAVQATGEVTLTGVNGTIIGGGTQVGTEPTDPEGDAPEFETTAPGTIAAGEVTVPVRALLGGTAGNVAATAITALLVEDPNITAVTNEAPTVGGTDTETDDDLRERFLALFGGGGGWNQAQFKVAALSYGGGIGRATVIPLWAGPGTVKVILATAAGDPVAAGTVTGFQNFIDPIVQQGAGAAMVGLAVTVQTVAALNVTVAGTIEHEPGYSLDGDGGTIATRPIIDLRVRAYVEGVESGDEIVHQLVVAAMAVRGVHDLGGVTINGGGGNLAVSGGVAPEAPSLIALNLVEGAV